MPNKPEHDLKTFWAAVKDKDLAHREMSAAKKKKGRDLTYDEQIAILKKHRLESDGMRRMRKKKSMRD